MIDLQCLGPGWWEIFFSLEMIGPFTLSQIYLQGPLLFSGSSETRTVTLATIQKPMQNSAILFLYLFFNSSALHVYLAWAMITGLKWSYSVRGRMEELRAGAAGLPHQQLEARSYQLQFIGKPRVWGLVLSYVEWREVHLFVKCCCVCDLCQK